MPKHMTITISIIAIVIQRKGPIPLVAILARTLSDGWLDRVQA